MGRKTNYNGTPGQRFWQKVHRAGDTDCWQWVAATTGSGYGVFRIDGKLVRAHRWSYAKYRGEIPKGMHVCHHCDRPSCVRPSHLFLGTQADNLADMARKGRQAKGDTHGNSKLAETDVVAIKKRLANGESQTAIAADYGVSDSRISEIKKGKTWRHMEVAT